MKPQNPNLSRPWRTLAMVTLGLTIGSSAWSQDAANEDKNVFELSPFEVDASNDQGYYSERTLAGSRIDTPLRDLAASISVVNREQLEDTAATDVNEVFLYELNTEGADTYTQTITSFRDGLRDGNSGFTAGDTGNAVSYSTSNRIRGLAAPDNSRNYYRAIPQMGFDTYNTRSVEINRGPNSLLFGQGSPAGIVNQNTSDAITNVERGEIQFRVGSYGSYRGHLNYNLPIIEDKLAVYVAALYDNEEFKRKPSYEVERRGYIAATYNPFKKLGIKGNFEKFKNSQSRPNTLTPVDAVTPWLEAGRPYYNPTNLTVYVQDTGQVFGPYARDSDSPNQVPGAPTGSNGLNSPSSPLYVPGISFIGGRPLTFIDSRENYFTMDTINNGRNYTRQDPQYINLPPAEANRTKEQWDIYDRNWSRSATYPSERSTISNWQPVGVTDKSIYDWSKYNTNTPNSGVLKGDTTNFEISYQILDNWYVQVGYFDQNLRTEEHFTLGQLNANRLYVETNLTLINGEPNPFFGQPYLEDYLPDTFTNTIDNTTFRAQTALTLDFRDKDGIMKWLGGHNFVAIATRADWDTGRVRYRATTGSGHPAFIPNYNLEDRPLWDRGDRLIRQYYMGEPGVQGMVTRSAPIFGQPDFGGPTDVTSIYYDWAAGGFQNVDNTWTSAISEAGSILREERTDSLTLSWSASLLWDRLVPVVGYRHDEITSRQTFWSGDYAELTVNGNPDFGQYWANWVEQVSEGETVTYGATLDVWRNDQHEITIFYNSSENFNPQAGVNVDLYGNRLQDPGGEGEDYGFSVGLWNNKLTARVTWFEATSTGDVQGPASASIARLIRHDTDFFFDWAETVARMEAGQLDAFQDPLRSPYDELPLESTPSLQQRMEQLTGLPYDYYDNLPGSPKGTQTNKAEGMEIAITYNPSRNWTFRAAISSQETAFSEVGPEVDAWLDDRMAVWNSATSGLPANLNTWELDRGGDIGIQTVQLANFNSSTGYGDAYANHPQNWFVAEDFYTTAVLPNIALYKAQQGRPVDNQRKYRANLIGRYTFSEGPLTGSFIGGGLRWEDKVGIGYYGYETTPGSGVLDAADLSRPIYDGSNLYVDLWIGYRTKILNDRAEMLLQLNVRNVTESGGLAPVGADFAGTRHTYRIIDPREFYLTTTFKF